MKERNGYSEKKKSLHRQLQSRGSPTKSRWRFQVKGVNLGK